MSRMSVVNVNEHVPVDSDRPDGPQAMPIRDAASGELTGYVQADITFTSVAAGTAAAFTDAPHGSEAQDRAIDTMGVQTNGRAIMTTSKN